MRAGAASYSDKSTGKFAARANRVAIEPNAPGHSEEWTKGLEQG